MLAETKEKLEQKIKELEVKLHGAEIDVAEAVEHGTWHDNFAFEQSQQTRDFYQSQLNDLRQKFKNAELIKPNTDVSKVCLGHKVVLIDGKKEIVYTIVGELDSDLNRGLISYTSPVGKELLGKSVGEKTASGLTVTEIALPV